VRSDQTEWKTAERIRETVAYVVTECIHYKDKEKEFQSALCDLVIDRLLKQNDDRQCCNIGKDKDNLAEQDVLGKEGSITRGNGHIYRRHRYSYLDQETSDDEDYFYGNDEDCLDGEYVERKTQEYRRLTRPRMTRPPVLICARVVQEQCPPGDLMESAFAASAHLGIDDLFDKLSNRFVHDVKTVFGWTLECAILTFNGDTDENKITFLLEDDYYRQGYREACITTCLSKAAREGRRKLTTQFVSTRFAFPLNQAMLNKALVAALDQDCMTVVHVLLSATIEPHKLVRLNVFAACRDSFMPIAAKKVTNLIREPPRFRNLRTKEALNGEGRTNWEQMESEPDTALTDNYDRHLHVAENQSKAIGTGMETRKRKSSTLPTDYSQRPGQRRRLF
jgi:hypothetical protein